MNEFKQQNLKYNSEQVCKVEDSTQPYESSHVLLDLNETQEPSIFQWISRKE